jgi:hypothetical protein
LSENQGRSYRSQTAANNMRGFREDQDDQENNDHKRAFNREDFRILINKTYNEYYGKFRDQFNPEEYIQCVDDE